MTEPDTERVAEVYDHPFKPKRENEPWGLCGHPGCNLSEAAHIHPGNFRYISEAPPAPPQKPPPTAREQPSEDETLPPGDGTVIHMSQYEELKPVPPSCFGCGSKELLIAAQIGNDKIYYCPKCARR